MSVGVLGVIATVVGVPLVLQQTWLHIVRPRLKRTKLRRAFELIQTWFDQVDRNIEHGVDRPLIDNLEGKIDSYLRDHALERHSIRFSKRFRRRFLREVGIKRELLDNPELFEKFARSPLSGTDLGTWWGMTRGAFYRFSAAYERNSADTNFADVQMRVRLLRLYLRIKSE